MKSCRKGVSFFNLNLTGNQVLAIILFLVVLVFFVILLTDEIQPIIEELKGEILDADSLGP